MAEKRKLLAEIEKCYKKIDEGVELFEETMGKMHEANSDNQRDKYQDDLKKEIKKLQRLRDQVKGWQNSSDIKDKEKLTTYRKLIEQRMEQFKDVERENKTKPHSKLGLSAEEKLDPKEKEKYDTVEWIQARIREMNDEADRTEMRTESLMNADTGKKRGKKEDLKAKGEKEKRIEELKRYLERLKYHVGKLEICMRMVNNETLNAKTVMETLKDGIETYTEVFDQELNLDEHMYDPDDIYDDLNLGALCNQIGGLSVGSVDDDHKENVALNGDESGSRHHSSDSPTSPAGKRTVPPPSLPSPVLVLEKKVLTKEHSLDSNSTSSSAPPQQATVIPPPPGIPYNSVAAGRSVTSTPPATSTTTTTSNPVLPTSTPQTPKTTAPTTTYAPLNSSPVVRQSPVASTPIAKPPSATAPSGTENEETETESVVLPPAHLPPSDEVVVVDHESLVSSPATTENEKEEDGSEEAGSPQETNTEDSILEKTLDLSSINGDVSAKSSMTTAEDSALRALRLSSQQQKLLNSNEPKRANIPAWLGASPLGRVPVSQEYESQLSILDMVLDRTQFPLDSDKPKTYLPKLTCPSPAFYPQNAPSASDTLEYYLRLTPDTLFFIFYYMEGTRAQLLAAKALKKLSWRFHTKYLTWFQRHEEPKQITDDYEQGTYVYFDFEKWSQRKKESFMFEYKFLEDKEFD